MNTTHGPDRRLRDRVHSIGASDAHIRLEGRGQPLQPRTALALAESTCIVDALLLASRLEEDGPRGTQYTTLYCQLGWAYLPKVEVWALSEYLQYTVQEGIGSS